MQDNASSHSEKLTIAHVAKKKKKSFKDSKLMESPPASPAINPSFKKMHENEKQYPSC